jgi:hypothetical protein
MFSISALTLRVIPPDLREKYIEIWRAGKDSAEDEESKVYFTNLQLISLGLRLRWQSDSFQLGRLAVRTMVGLLLAVAYAEFGLAREILVLFVVWWLVRRSDFREIHARRALKATGVHLCVSMVAFALGLLTYWVRISNHQDLVYFLKSMEFVGVTFVAASFLTAVVAGLFWLADFLSTNNVLVSGKLFSSLAVALLGIQWLEHSRNTVQLINSDAWLSNILLPVSKVQQVTTNLVLPLLACFMILTGIMEYRRRKYLGRAQQVGRESS